MATISRKSSLTTIVLVIIVFAFGFLTANSCKSDQEKGMWIPIPPDSSALGKIDHFIPMGTMNTFKADFAAARDSIMRRVPNLYLPPREAFNKQWLLEVLKDPKCVGLRIYYGVKGKLPNGGTEFRLMIVGVDAQGNDLYISKTSTLAGRQDDDEGKGGLEWGQCEQPCSTP